MRNKVRKTVGLAGVVIAATGCLGTGATINSAEEGPGLTPAIEPTPAEVICLVVAPDAYTQPNAVAQMRAIYGGDVGYEYGTWFDASSGTKLGFSLHEDSIIWNYPECTEGEIQYLSEGY